MLISTTLLTVFLIEYSPGRTAEGLGNFKSYTKIDHGVLVAADNGTIMLEVYSPTVIRVRVTKGEFLKDFSYAVIRNPEGMFTGIQEDGKELRLSTDSLEIFVSEKPVRLHFYNRQHRLLNEDDAGLGFVSEGTQKTSYKHLFPDERFIGLGEKTGPLDRRGQSYVNWNTDHYSYGVEDDPLYASIPFFIGLHDHLTYGIFLDNSYRTNFDFGASSDNRFSSFSVSDGEMNYYFFGDCSVGEIISSYTALTGRIQMPPRWSLGYQQCRWSYYPDAEVLKLAATFREKQIPADVIYLDIHYMDGYKVFTWDLNRFPDPKKMIDSLRAAGFHLVTIIDPGIKVENGYFAHDEGVAGDYFIKYPDGENYIGSVWPGRCHFPDFTNPDVRTWWGKSVSRLVTPGVEGFWNDMNEPAVWGQHIPDIVRLSFDGSPTTIQEAHNVYGMEMARSTFEGARALMSGKRPFVLSRAGYAGIQRYSALWTGDNASTDEHMLLAVRLVNSMGVSGIPFTGPDIGGFSGDPTPELFTRWLSIGAYTPFYRNHKQYGRKRQEPWSFGEETEKLARQCIEQRYRMMPYLYSTFFTAAETGMPVARTLAIVQPFDEHVYWSQYQNEYLFGDNLLVAPVASKESYADVYFPSGGWYRLSDDTYYRGDTSALVRSPLDDLPVFTRAGSVLPFQSVVQNTSQRTSDTLQLHVYFGKEASTFVYYEDDGITYDYQKGISSSREIRFEPSEKRVTLGNVNGSYPLSFHFVKLILHGFKELKTITTGRGSLNVMNLPGHPGVYAVTIENSRSRISIRW
ncbi:MAG TPA: TIM-barrel domain-containing protein [Bacteroidota bacterium]|nr:TIM-barrel domain-containing protein [Bacteroidota bacterium]